MAKKRRKLAPELRPGKALKLPSRKVMEEMMRKTREDLEKHKRKEERESHRAFINSGVRTGLPVKAVLWIMKNFERSGSFNWNKRVGR